VEIGSPIQWVSFTGRGKDRCRKKREEKTNIDTGGGDALCKTHTNADLNHFFKGRRIKKAPFRENGPGLIFQQLLETSELLETFSSSTT
jgi:hypothetical protein